MTDSPSTRNEPQAIPSGGVARGRVRVPSSKSFTHRYLNLALLARQAVVIERPLVADDTRLFLAALAGCGWWVEPRREEVHLRPPRAGAPPPGEPVEILCGNAGTMARFLVASLAALPGRWRLDGGLDAGESSQFLSALLMAGLAAPRPVTVEVTSLTSAPYVEITLAAVRSCGGRIEASAGDAGITTYRVSPGLALPPRLRVEGDASAACYPAAAAALTGGKVVLEGLAADSPQGDRRFLELLAGMGAEVAWDGDDVEVRGARLRAVAADLSAMPDQVPTLSALAPFARGTTRILNVAHLRLKESDRLAAMASELRRLGAEVEEGADRLDIAGTWCEAPPPDRPVTVDAHGDHRIAMSLALVGLRRPGVEVAAPQVVAKSYPDFWQDFLGLLRQA